MRYDVVIVEEGEGREIGVVHERGCERRVVEVAAARVMLRQRAWVVQLESEEMDVARVEAGVMIGAKDRRQVVVCGACCGGGRRKKKGGEIARGVKVRRNGLGMMVVETGGTRVVVCEGCGGVSGVGRMHCSVCGEYLWGGLEGRLYGMNGRLRAAMRKGDGREMGRLRAVIADMVRVRPGAYDVDELGLAVVRRREVRKEGREEAEG